MRTPPLNLSVHFIKLLNQNYDKHLHAVSSSILENPNALSPCTHTILLGVREASVWLSAIRAAAIANPIPTPIVPNVPASSLKRSNMEEKAKCDTKIGYCHSLSMPFAKSIKKYFKTHYRRCGCHYLRKQQTLCDVTTRFLGK